MKGGHVPGFCEVPNVPCVAADAPQRQQLPRTTNGPVLPAGRDWWWWAPSAGVTFPRAPFAEADMLLLTLLILI